MADPRPEAVDDGFVTWFLGLDRAPTPEEIEKILAAHDQVLRFPGGLIMMRVDPSAGVAEIHVFLQPVARKARQVAFIVSSAVERARSLGCQKVVAPLISGSPFLKPGRRIKFGFVLEGVLRRHVRVAGELRDLFIYSRFI
jgi:hypothetical protein